MPEYKWALGNGDIVSADYNRTNDSLSNEQVLAELQSAFQQFGHFVHCEPVSDQFPEVYAITFEGNALGKITVCAKGTTPGGRSTLNDEQRTQQKSKYINYTYSKHESEEIAIQLGVYKRDDSTVFCAWKLKPSSAGPDTPISKQIKIDTIAQAMKEGFAQQDKGSGEYACAFRKEFIYFYIRNLELVHNYQIGNLINDVSDVNTPFSPQWFNEKAKNYVGFDSEAEGLLGRFLEKFSPGYLRSLSGTELLKHIFLNNENKENLCYILEFDPVFRSFFGSIKGGSAFKYGLYCSKQNEWTSGTNQNPQILSENEAVELGEKIRDYLVVGAEVIAGHDSFDTVTDYKNLYEKLYKVTDGYINKIWVLKYYQMLYPELFAPNYSSSAQKIVLDIIGENNEENAFVNMGRIRFYANKCEISNVLFNKIFWDNYSEEATEATSDCEETKTFINYRTGYDCSYSRNRILFGAPGTGKSFTLNREMAQLLADGGEYERVTFHPDYSYANFVGTYKPVPYKDDQGHDAITYAYVPGPFMRTYVKALRNSRTDVPKPFLLVIEEINRANVAAVFGDVFQLLDRDDDEVSEYPIQASEDIKKYLADELGGNPDDYPEIRIPDNMFIWATMNSADQGVFPMDTAFKRRWDFTYLGIDGSEAGIVGKKVILGQGDYRRIVEWNALRKAINDELLTYKVNEDKLMGPYFISKKNLPEGELIDPDVFTRIFKNKVIMYLFDDAAKQKRITLFGGCDERARNQYSKICREFDTKGVYIFCEGISSQFIDNVPEDDGE